MDTPYIESYKAINIIPQYALKIKGEVRGTAVLSRGEEAMLLNMVELESTIQSLSEPHRAVLGLSLAGYKRKEITELLGLPGTRVAELYKSALERLKNAYLSG